MLTTMSEKTANTSLSRTYLCISTFKSALLYQGIKDTRYKKSTVAFLEVFLNIFGESPIAFPIKKYYTKANKYEKTGDTFQLLEIVHYQFRLNLNNSLTVRL